MTARRRTRTRRGTTSPVRDATTDVPSPATTDAQPDDDPAPSAGAPTSEPLAHALQHALVHAPAPAPGHAPGHAASPNLPLATVHATMPELLSWAADAATSAEMTAFAIGIDRLRVASEVLGVDAPATLAAALAQRLALWGGGMAGLVRTGVGGFVALRVDLSAAQAPDAAERLRVVLAEGVPVTSGVVSRSVSIGVAVDPTGSSTAGQLVVHAMHAGRSARAAGGDSVRVYDAETERTRAEELRLELELHAAVDAGELRLHYQPEFDLLSRRIIGAEALVRWQHPRRGLLGADAFAVPAESGHSFARVGRWVLEQACAQVATWQASPDTAELVLRVNVSAAEIARDEFVNDALAVIERHDVPAGHLCIELTERNMPTETAELAAELTRLRAAGVLIALDDFGTGVNTLSHLLTLRVDAVKIDKMFVAQMTSDLRAETIVAAVVTLAGYLGLDVVAEGVDGESTIAALLGVGARRAQGNGLAAAMPIEDLEALLHG